MRVGIFFGGPSREREISFAGGKTAFEHLSKKLFQPVPVFVDGFGRFILLKHGHMYAPEIRAFYPWAGISPSSRLYIESFPGLEKQDIPPEIGTLLEPSRFSDHFDFAFLAMHGPDCEDGGIQGLLEWYRIPYSGPGLLGSSIGIDKILQNKMLGTVTGQEKATDLVTFSEWQREESRAAVFESVKSGLGLPVVVKAPHQGSSIGVAIVKDDDPEAFRKGVDQCFFAASVSKQFWDSSGRQDKMTWAEAQADLESGVGYPLYIEETKIDSPGELVAELDRRFNDNSIPQVLLSADFEPVVLCEEFISGQEFSCGCIQLEDGTHVALPPTEVIKVDEVFDFNSKYKPGGTRKRIPVSTSLENNLKIQERVANAAAGLGMDVCVRIDGFLTQRGTVVLHDPNTVPGMSPSSLIFKQMAEIGLNITQSLTYLIRQSVRVRIRTAKDTVRLNSLLKVLDDAMEAQRQAERPVRSMVIDATDEAYARAKKWYAQQCAGEEVHAEVYLKRDNEKLVRLPVPLLFKDFVEDVTGALDRGIDPLIEDTRRKCREITARYAGDVDFEARPVPGEFGQDL
ncbi:MAG: D-alanine--D-alanine ligase [Cytophagaceae bacterium SCN 52-12]|nr:MAG: D-alanine--D-alanine ligase [Cytophagaceae bacterium SCN 52-12]